MSVQFRSPFGAPKYSSGVAVAASVATMAALRALSDPGDLVHGNECRVDADGSEWVFHSTSTLTGDNLFVATPDAAAYASAGRWLRKSGPVDLALAIAYTTADAAVLATLPAGARLVVQGGYWEVTTGFTGGSSSAIGLNSSQTGHTTAGDVLGGSGGDVTALLGTAGIKEATIGADVAAGMVLRATETIKFNRITSQFAAGAGYAHIVGFLINPGA
jgi:hypothetical protein